jgi:hypothetical protein
MDGDQLDKGAPDEGQGEAIPGTPPAPLKQDQLLHARATPLNQDNQHDDKKQSGHNPDNRGLIHFDSLPSLNGCGLSVRKKF